MIYNFLIFILMNIFILVFFGMLSIIISKMKIVGNIINSKLIINLMLCFTIVLFLVAVGLPRAETILVAFVAIVFSGATYVINNYA